MSPFKKLSLFAGIIAYSNFSCASQDTLDSLSKTHPRLIATESDWQNIKSQINSDENLASFADNLLATAKGLLNEPPSAYEKTGRRLLPVSRETLRRTLILASAFRITGNEAFAKRAEQELQAVIAFPDWNPSHFIDIGEMTTAVAIGYDWFYNELSPDTRKSIREAIIKKALLEGLDANSKDNGWYNWPNNWPVVCWSGLSLGAITVAEQEPELAAKTLEMARSHIAIGLTPYLPDGLYPEGPSYWGYGSTYYILLTSALQSAFGESWNFAETDAFLASGKALTQQTGPSGLSFNFSDGVEKSAFHIPLLWFSKYTKEPELLAPHHAAINQLVKDRDVFDSDRFTALALLWWPANSNAASKKLPTAWHTDGEQPVAVLRGSWEDPNTSYIACKGGSATISHSHLDAGTFVFESDGVRWARDLGPQTYNSLEAKGIKLWDKSQESERWTVFRLNNRSHNTLVIDDQLQSAYGHATISKFKDGERPFSIFDLTEIYEGQAAKVQRGIRMEKDGRTLIQDELTGLKPGSQVRWAMVTEASGEIDGTNATLSQDGKSLKAQLLSPTQTRFEIIPADPPQDGFNVANPNHRILIATATAPENGTLTLSVLLTPGSAAKSSKPYKLTSLENWDN